MKTKHTPQALAQLVDELAAIRADLADLKATEETYRAELIAADLPAIDGTLHRVTVSSSSRTTTNWQTIAETLAEKLSKIEAANFDAKKFERLTAKHTSTSAPTFTVRITARKVSA